MAAATVYININVYINIKYINIYKYIGQPCRFEQCTHKIVSFILINFIQLFKHVFVWCSPVTIWIHGIRVLGRSFFGGFLGQEFFFSRIFGSFPIFGWGFMLAIKNWQDFTVWNSNFIFITIYFISKGKVCISESSFRLHLFLWNFPGINI